MSWHEETVTLEFTDEKGENVGDVEITKSEFVNISSLAAKEGITVNEMVVRLLEQRLKEDE